MISEDRMTLHLMLPTLFYVYVCFLISVFKFDLQARAIQTLDSELFIISSMNTAVYCVINM